MDYHRLSTIAFFNQGTIVVSNEGFVHSFGRIEYGANGFKEKIISLVPTKIPSLMNVQSISCGMYHTVCLNNNGNVFTFGNNVHGQLGIGKKGLFQTSYDSSLCRKSMPF